MRFFREHKTASIIIAIVLVVLIVFVFSISGTLSGNPIFGVLSKGMKTVNTAGNTLSENIRNGISGIFKYKELEQENIELKNEILELQRRLSEAELDQDELEQLQELSGVLNYEYTKRKFDIVSAGITAVDGSNWLNIITLSEGESAGIEVGDAVISGMGLVGRITETGEDWSKVTTIVEKDTNVSFRLVRDKSQFGVCSGTPTGELTGYMMDADSTVTEGDVLVTSGLGTYPEGIEIGIVKTVKYNSNTMLKEIQVDTSVNFSELLKVSVIIN